jgi:hypothetical protein
MNRNIFIKLIVVTLNLLKPDEVHILSESSTKIQLPTHPFNSIKEIVTKYTDLSINWLQPKLLSIEDKEPDFFIYYYITLPPGTELLEGYWILLEKSDNQHIKDLAIKGSRIILMTSN